MTFLRTVVFLVVLSALWTSPSRGSADNLQAALHGASIEQQEPRASTVHNKYRGTQGPDVFLFLTGFAAAFTVLHLLLFLFLPTAKGNLYYAVFTAFQAGFFFTLTKVNLPAPPAVEDFRLRGLWTCGILMCLFAILFQHHVFENGSSFSLKLLAFAGGALIMHSWLRPTSASLGVVNFFAFVLSAEMLRRVAVAIWDRRPDAWVVGLGFVALTVTGLYVTAGNLGWLDTHNPQAFPIGVFGLTVSMSAYLSRRVAGTQKDLERQLAEVRRLDAKALDQERKAHEARMASRLLEVETRRQTAELEEARHLQLSMLPERPPCLKTVEVAFETWTASQVGGDYYDYKEDGDGVLTLAIGDATGHGLNSGLMVASTKSLFQSGTEGESLPETLARISRGIKGMRLKRMNFAMLLVRIEDRSFRLASAGMPPALLYRAESREVEEILLPGPPLGTMSFPYREHLLLLEPGDTLLLMSDGLPEMVHRDGDLLGYERSLELFRDVASEKLETILRYLSEAASDFADGHLQEDDMTLVVLRALDAARGENTSSEMESATPRGAR